MKTYSPKPQHIERRWYVIDASDLVLGRLASEVAAILRGKHKPMFAPHMDTGDNVIVINASKVVLTGGKEMKKMAWRHSGYPGGITGIRYDRLMAERPVFVLEKAVRGMLPKNSLGRQMIKKLHVHEGAEHNHQAQKPVAYELGKPPVWEGLPEPKVRAIREPKKKAPVAKAAEKEPATKPAAKPKASAAKPKAAAAKPKPAAPKPKAEKTEKAPRASRAKKTEGKDA